MDTEPHAFLAARVLDRWVEAEDLVGLRVEVPAGVTASYTVPGQYVQLRVPGTASTFLAIASPPGPGPLEFLVKQAPTVAGLLAVAPGAVLEVTDAKGAGYPVAAHLGHDVLLFAAGSGMSPIRALIGYLAVHRAQYAGVTLFLGARTQAHMPYLAEVEHWERAGIQVVRVLSRPGETKTAGFAAGYVQEALQKHPVQPGKTVAFVCGMPPMVEGVSAELVRRGVPAERVFQNY